MTDWRNEVEGEFGSLSWGFDNEESVGWARMAGDAGRPFRAREGRARERVELMYCEKGRTSVINYMTNTTCSSMRESPYFVD